MGYVEEFYGGALVGGFTGGEGAALRGREGGVRGVLDYGAELGEGGLGEKFDGDTYRGGGHGGGHFGGWGGVWDLEKGRVLKA